MSTIALIVAAGRGERLGSATPKQYLAVAGQPVLRRTARAFLAQPRIDAIRVVTREADRGFYQAAVGDLDLMAPVAGGASRQESVARGLESLTGQGVERVLIHDAARPFVAPALIDGVLDALAAAPGAIPALGLNDSLKRGADGRVVAAVDRAGLYRAQTPQAFRFPAILAAHRAAAGRDLSDDAAVAQLAGLDVALTAGSEDNFKITTPADLERAERMLAGAGRVVRVGQGFDVHRFAANRPLVLCGVRVPHDQGLAGHSDADVALHALTDAVLGALAAGDIGDHFPPDDPAWRDARSDRFLAHAVDLVARAGGRVTGLDVTVICERPKIGPHRPAMRRRVAEIAGLDLDQVSVKATTTERLGFTGRGEGIAAQAVATLALPDGP